MTAARLRDRFLHYLRYARGLELRQATAADHLAALELVVRETLIDRAVRTSARSTTLDLVQPVA